MPAIKHHEILRNDDYFKGGALPCVVREMRDAPSNAFVAMHDHEFSELVIAGGTTRYRFYTAPVNKRDYEFWFT